MNQILNTLLDTSTFIHAGYIILIFALFIQNRSCSLMLYSQIEKNIIICDNISKFKTNLVSVQAEQIKLLKESQQHNYEIQILNQQLNRLREEIKTLNTTERTQ